MWKLDQSPVVYSSDTQENPVASSGEEHVLVKLLTSNHVPANSTSVGESSSVERTSNGSDVIAKLLTTSTSGIVSPAVAVGAYVLANIQIGGFRKIEPRPGSEEMKMQESEETSEDQNKTPNGKRLLDINATRRGVKSCPQCLKKIGYRSKLCKYCYPGKKRPPRRARQILKPKKPELHQAVSVCDVDRDEVSTVDFSNVMVGNETEVSTTEEPSVTQTAGPEESRAVEQPHVSEQIESITMQDDDSTHYLVEEVQTDDTAQDKDDGNEQQFISEVPDANQVVTADQSSEQSCNVQVFSVEEPTSATNPTSERVQQQRANLQALICSLLAQTQSSTAEIKSGRSSVSEDVSVKASETLPGTSSTDSLQDVNLVSTVATQLEQDDGQVSQSDVNTKTSENGFDANSVALFLGHLAQQNNGKKKLRGPVQTKEANVSQGDVKPLPGTRGMPIIIYDDSKPAKLRRIEPKVGGDITVVETGPEIATTKPLEDIRVKEKEPSTESRFLTGSATRRGKMPCQKCKNLIGCRSKTCKYCKSTVTNESLPLARGSAMQQAVILQLPSFMENVIYSVRKSRAGPDQRCFVRCEAVSEGESRGNSGSSFSTVFSCDYPPCVTIQELGEHPQDYMCEHAKLCRGQSCVTKAKIPVLRIEKQDELPVSHEVKDILNLLQDQCLAKGVPMVQLLSNKTLAVVEQLGANEDNTLVPEVASFVHVRFDKTKTSTGIQAQAFCTGRPCMAWNPVFSTTYKPATGSSSNVRLSSCTHFAACLWAIASDEGLDRDFGLYLRAAQGVSGVLAGETDPTSTAAVVETIGDSIM